MLVLTALWKDEAGFIVSAELVLVASIAVLGLIVGLSEVSLNVNNELEDVGSAFASTTVGERDRARIAPVAAAGAAYRLPNRAAAEIMVILVLDFL